MTAEQISGIVRALVAAVGGYFVGKGIVDADTVSSVGGALATIATAVWSFQSKKGA
tara:strand:+ start:792 stop:959 length:168 start_codon:yes stop_codon:yes gene_type:complete